MSEDALLQKKIFISHKSEDLEKIKSLIDILKSHCNSKVEFVYSDAMPKGHKWWDWIYKTTTTSDALLLLIISNNGNWEWCLFEAGLFLGSKSKSPNQVIQVLHSEEIDVNRILGPLQPFQNTKINKLQLEGFLEQFYGTSKLVNITPPINELLSNSSSDIEKMAHEICKVLA